MIILMYITNNFCQITINYKYNIVDFKYKILISIFISFI